MRPPQIEPAQLSRSHPHPAVKTSFQPLPVPPPMVADTHGFQCFVSQVDGFALPFFGI
jgi:hypothetical protein